MRKSGRGFFLTGVVAALLLGVLAIVAAPVRAQSAQMRSVLHPALHPALHPTATSSWGIQVTYKPFVSSLNSVSCPTTSECIAVGQLSSGAGAIFGTANGGATWSAEAAPAGVGFLYGISCPSTSDCWAVGQNPSASSGAVIGTTNGGKN